MYGTLATSCFCSICLCSASRKPTLTLLCTRGYKISSPLCHCSSQLFALRALLSCISTTPAAAASPPLAVLFAGSPPMASNTPPVMLLLQRALPVAMDRPTCCSIASSLCAPCRQPEVAAVASPAAASRPPLRFLLTASLSPVAGAASASCSRAPHSSSSPMSP